MAIFAIIGAAIAEFTGIGLTGFEAGVIGRSEPFSSLRTPTAFRYASFGAVLGMILGPIFGASAARKEKKRKEGL